MPVHEKNHEGLEQELRDMIDRSTDVVGKMLSERATLKARIAELTEALTFYAEEDRYDLDETACPGAYLTKKRVKEIMKTGGFVIGDDGKRARSALSQSVEGG